MLIITISPLGEEGTEIIEGHTGNVKPARRSVMVTMAMRILTLDICTYIRLFQGGAFFILHIFHFLFVMKMTNVNKEIIKTGQLSSNANQPTVMRQ